MTNYIDDSKIIKYKREKKIFFERNMVFKKFKYITDERKDEIKVDVFEWNKKQIFNNNMSKLLAVFLYLKFDNLNNRLGKEATFYYSNSDEELLFYLFSIDPELKLLQIYYNENNKREIKKRFFEEFGLDYDSRLLTIELMYNKQFPTIIDEFDKPQILSRKKEEGNL